MTIDTTDMLPDEVAYVQAKQSGKPIEVPAADAEDTADEAPSASDDSAETPVAEAETAAAEAAEAPEAKEANGEPAAPAETDDAPKLGEALTYRTDDPASIAEAAKTLKQQRKEARAERNAIDQRWLTGDLSDEERVSALSALDDRLDSIDDQIQELVRQQTRAETLAEASRQETERAQVALLDRYRVLGKAAGLDYSAAEHAEAFDMALQISLKQGKTFEQAAAKAHQTVLAMNGKAQSPAQAAKATAQPAAPVQKPDRTPPKGPVTLADAPRAGTNLPQQDIMAQFANYTDPDEAEAAYAAMPKSKREALLRATVRG